MNWWKTSRVWQSLVNSACLGLGVGGEGDLVVAGVLVLDAALVDHDGVRAALVPLLGRVGAPLLLRAGLLLFRVLLLVPIRRLRRAARERLQHVRHRRRRFLLLLRLGGIALHE